MKLGRIYKYWAQIIGEEYTLKVMPIELKTRPVKIKGAKRTDEKQYNIHATLHVITDSANALPLSYQKERILGRCEHLFGERIITDIKIIHNHSMQARRVSNDRKDVSLADKQEINAMIDNIDDQALRERLESFAQSLYQSRKQN